MMSACPPPTTRHLTTLAKAACVPIRQGRVIAYPTEGVWGLGCDPFNRTAVCHVCALKGRTLDKGLILIAAHWEHVQPLIAPVPPIQLNKILKQWPSPTTWLFPASEKVPHWVRGKHPNVAIRLTAHPLAHALSHAFNGPLISTSANPHGLPPALEEKTVKAYFQNKVICMPGSLGDQPGQPTAIYCAITGQQVR